LTPAFLKTVCFLNSFGSDVEDGTSLTPGMLDVLVEEKEVKVEKIPITFED
jgi:hypothetical protein